MLNDPRDRIILEHAPLVAVPRFGELPALDHDGHRYLAAEDGLWFEIVRPWLGMRTCIAQSDVPLPYGRVEPILIYAFSQEDLERIQTLFIYDGRNALPNECAAWAVWNAQTHTLDYVPLIADASSPGGVSFHRPRLDPHQTLAIDLHSHGAMQAFFSTQDDDDDAGEVKLSVVVGTLDREPTFETRLCALGLFIPSNEPGGEMACRACGCTNLQPCPGGCEWVEPGLCSRCA